MLDARVITTGSLIGDEVGPRQQIAGPAFDAEYGLLGFSGYCSSASAGSCEAAVHFVGGDMHETRDAVQPRRFQQRERAVVIGANHRFRREDTAVDVRLRREMDDGVRAYFAYQGVHQCRVADIALHEAVALVAIDARQILQISRVS